MVKSLDYRSKQVRTSVAPLGSLSVKYIWEIYEGLHPPSYGANITLFRKARFGIK